MSWLDKPLSPKTLMALSCGGLGFVVVLIGDQVGMPYWVSIMSGLITWVCVFDIVAYIKGKGGD
jgi:hypothetical protein